MNMLTDDKQLEEMIHDYADIKCYSAKKERRSTAWRR